MAREAGTVDDTAATGATATPVARASVRPAGPAGPAERTWPAALVLLWLAPGVAELLSGSTPPLRFFNPLSLFLEGGLYGCGALLIRDAVRHRLLGWPSVLLLGAAYGVLEEGLVITSWFNPYWPDLARLATFGRAFDTSWIWALGLTSYHMIVSITLPILLTETLFPRIAGRPWLGRKGTRAAAIWLGAASLLGLAAFGFLAYRTQGYMHPPLMWLGALLLALALVWAALHLPHAGAGRPIAPAFAPRPAPRVWRVRLAALLYAAAFFFCLWALPNLGPPPWVVALCMVVVLALSLGTAHRWSARQGWGVRHRLALATGVLGFFLLLAPLLEFGPRNTKPETGMTLAALCWLAFCIWLSRRAARLERASPLA